MSLRKQMLHEMSRRQFLKAAGVAAAGAAALHGASLPAMAEEEASAPMHSWEVAPEPIDEGMIAEEKDYDIVIVGGGVAGNAAAEAAAGEGAKVALIEQSGDITAHGCDNGCIDSKFQKELGIEFDKDTIFKLLYRWSQQQANPHLIRTWIDKSGGVFDHICDLATAHGYGLISAFSNTSKEDWETNDEWFREYRTSISFGDPSEGIIIDFEKFQFLQYHLVEMLMQEAEGHGAEYFFNTHAEQLVKADDRITGVVAKDADGNYIRFNASKGVILATGDISGNPDMMKTFAPIALRADAVAYFPYMGNWGDGINMGCWAGAAVSRSTAAHMVHPISDAPLNAIDMSWLAVNRNGDRFAAEVPVEPYVTNARMNQPGNIAWNIYDGKFKERVEKQEPNTAEALLAGIDEKMENLAGSDLLYVADTLEDLADQLGIPADNFVATVERYNEMCAAGEDKDFGVPERFLAAVEEAPFYAVPIPAQTLCVPFGLHVDKNSQVCTEEDEPIGGLFAVGNVQGDFFGCSYPVFCPGISHGRAITFGSLVGKALAHDTVLTEE